MGHPHDKVNTLIEVRGEGGYVIIAPNYGKIHPSGKPYVLLRGGMESIVTITPEDREALFELAQIFDLMPKPKVDGPPMLTTDASGCRPGDRFNNQAKWENILEPYGWQKVFDRGGVGYWRRPGKDRGISATTNWESSGLLYVFSTSTGLEPERGYSKFAAYAQLVHGSDYKAAARELGQMG
jgi:putative DNA primase/helicase